MAVVVWGYAGGQGKPSPQPDDPPPRGPQEAAWSTLGPVWPAALCCPPVVAAQGPALPPTRPQLSSRWAGLGCGQLGRRPSQAIWAGATGTWAPTHTAAKSHPADPWGPQGSPTQGGHPHSDGPQPTLVLIPSRGSLAGPAEQQGAGARDRPWGPISWPQTSPSSRRHRPTGLPTISNTRSGQEPHCGLRGSQGFGQADPCPQETRSLCAALQPQTRVSCGTQRQGTQGHTAPGAKAPPSGIQRVLALGSELGPHPHTPPVPEPRTRSGVPGRTCPMPTAPQARSGSQDSSAGGPCTCEQGRAGSCSGEAHGPGASVLAGRGASSCLGLQAQKHL